MLQNIFFISISMSAIILVLLLISPLLSKRYSARWRYFVWMAIAVRLVIPIKFEIANAPLNIPVSNHTVVLRQEGPPIAIINDNYIEKGYYPPVSVDRSPVISLRKLLTIIWAIGATIFFLYHIINYIIFKRKIKPYLFKADYSIFNNILYEMQIKTKPQLFVCDKIDRPMMLGFFKPIILLTNATYSSDELNYILKHELCHFKRRDLWFKLILVAANAIHWFNPFIYIMAKEANRDMEYSCDDAVIKNNDINFRRGYSLTILKAMQNFGGNKDE